MTHQTETLSTARPFRKRTLSPLAVTFLRISIESGLIFVAAYASSQIYHSLAYGGTAAMLDYCQFGLAMALTFAMVSYLRDDLRQANHQVERKALPRLAQSWSIAFLAVIVTVFLAKTSQTYSRGSVILFYFVGLIMVAAARLQVTRLVSHLVRAGWASRGRVMLLGSAQDMERLIETCAPQRDGYDVVAMTVLENSADLSKATLDAWLQHTVERARWIQPDTVVLTLPWAQTETIDACIRAFMQMPVRVELAPETVLRRYSDFRLSRLGSSTMFNLLRPPLGTFARLTKRVFDFAGAFFGLVLLSPLFLIVAVLIKLDSSGPVLFRQTRFGFNQQPFRIWKFRSMTTMDDGAVVAQASRQDARVTRVGKYLRRLNIDELPQLINVLTGDMSLVGPRPHAVAHNRFYEAKIDLYARRHNVLPGITGWAQVNGLRGATDDESMSKRVTYDLYYLDNWSLTFDILIIFRTVFSIRGYKNAY